MADTELVPWEPRKFDGSDLLPVPSAQGDLNAVDYVDDEDMEADDFRLPTLEVLQGTSKVVQQGLEGAQPGKLYFSGNQKVIVPPARVIVIHRFRGNAMFMSNASDNPEGLEDCISRDGVTGTRYGDCETCGRCTKWRDGPKGEETLPPWGSKTQQVVVWCSDGIGILRASQSNKHVVRAFRDYQTRKTTTKRNWFTHPTVLHVDKHTNDKDQPFAVVRPQWDEKEVVPPAVQQEAAKWASQIREALELGKLTDDDDEPRPARGQEGDTPAQARAEANDDIPF